MLSNIHKFLRWSALAAVKLAVIGAFFVLFNEHKDAWWGKLGVFVSLVSVLWVLPKPSEAEPVADGELEEMF